MVAVFTGDDLNAGARADDPDAVRRRRDGPARRSSRSRPATCASSAIRSRSSSPPTATSPRTPPSSSRSTTTSLTPVVDYELRPATDAAQRPRRARRATWPPPWRCRSIPASRQIFDTAPHVVDRDVPPAPLQRGAHGDAAAWWPAGTPTEGSSTCGSRARTRTRPRLVFGRVTGVPESRIRVRIGDVGGGFGLKNFIGREEQVVVLAAYLLGPAGQVDRGPAREPDRVGPRPPRAGDGEGRRRCGRRVPRRPRRPPRRRRRLPDRRRQRRRPGRLFFPGPYRMPRLAWKTASVWTNTCGRAAYRGPWQMETTAREQMVDVVARAIGHRPARAAAPQRGPARRPALHDGRRAWSLENVSPAETLDQAAEAIDYAGFRRAAGRGLPTGRCSASASPSTSSRRRAWARSPTSRRTSACSPTAASTCILGSGRARPGARDDDRAARRRAPRRRHRRRHRAPGRHRVAPRSGPAPAAAAAARCSARRSAGVAPSYGTRRSPSPPTCSRPRRGPRPSSDGVISVAGTPQASVTLAAGGRAPPTSTRRSLPAGIEPGLEVMNRYKAPADHVLQRLPRLHGRGRPGHRRDRGSSATW